MKLFKWGLFVLLINLPSGPANTQSLDTYSLLNELTKMADYICIARVRKIESGWYSNNMGDRFIYSTISLDVEDNLKGSLDQEAKIASIGGSIDGIVSYSSQAPVFQNDEKILLFLKDFNGVLQPYRFSKGKYDVDKSGQIVFFGVSVKTLKEQINNILYRNKKEGPLVPEKTPQRKIINKSILEKESLGPLLWVH